MQTARISYAAEHRGRRFYAARAERGRQRSVRAARGHVQIHAAHARRERVREKHALVADEGAHLLRGEKCPAVARAAEERHLVADGQKQAASDAPSFAALARPSCTPEALADYLAMPGTTHARMPDLALSRVDIADIVAYVGTLKTP